MAGRKKIGAQLSLVLDDETRNAVESAVRQSGEPTAAVLRKAIKAGLQSDAKAEGGELVRLDGELSNDVGKFAEWLGWSRQRVLIEAFRVGLPSAYARNVPIQPEAKETLSTEDAERLRQLFAAHDPDGHPLGRDFIRLRARAASAERRLADVLGQVPEAADRLAKMEKLATLRARAGGSGSGLPYGESNEVIDWQIQMHEKHGPDYSKWPTKEPPKPAAKKPPKK